MPCPPLNRRLPGCHDTQSCTPVTFCVHTSTICRVTKADHHQQYHQGTSHSTLPASWSLVSPTLPWYTHVSSAGRNAFIHRTVWRIQFWLNPLTPNDIYRGRTAPLTSKRCILYIYSTNIGIEYLKRGIYSPFFPLQNAVCFIILTYLVPVLFTFYIFIQQI